MQRMISSGHAWTDQRADAAARARELDEKRVKGRKPHAWPEPDMRDVDARLRVLRNGRNLQARRGAAAPTHAQEQRHGAGAQGRGPRRNVFQGYCDPEHPEPGYRDDYAFQSEAHATQEMLAGGDGSTRRVAHVEKAVSDSRHPEDMRQTEAGLRIERHEAARQAVGDRDEARHNVQIGRASCRERVSSSV